MASHTSAHGVKLATLRHSEYGYVELELHVEKGAILLYDLMPKTDCTLTINGTVGSAQRRPDRFSALHTTIFDVDEVNCDPNGSRIALAHTDSEMGTVIDLIWRDSVPEDKQRVRLIG
jgi:hypothetical protein